MSTCLNTYTRAHTGARATGTAVGGLHLLSIVLTGVCPLPFRVCQGARGGPRTCIRLSYVVWVVYDDDDVVVVVVGRKSRSRLLNGRRTRALGSSAELKRAPVPLPLELAANFTGCTHYRLYASMTTENGDYGGTFGIGCLGACMCRLVDNKIVRFFFR